MPLDSSPAATSPKTTDADLQSRLVEFLSHRNLSSIQARVERGLVTVTGAVSSSFERQMIVLSLRRLPGVGRLSDQIRVGGPSTPRPSALGRARELGADLASAASDWFASTPKPAWIVVVLGLLAPLTLASCGSSDVKVPVHPVKGKLLVDGQPADGATITLNPQGDFPLKNAAPTATVKSDGTFAVNLYGNGDGAPAGNYVVTVQWFKLVKDPNGASGRGPNVLPAHYATPEKSPVKIVVKEGPNQLEPIEIRSK